MSKIFEPLSLIFPTHFTQLSSELGLALFFGERKQNLLLSARAEDIEEDMFDIIRN